MPDLRNLDVEWVSLVDRAAVRDPVEQSEPMRFLLTKGEVPIWKRHTPTTHEGDNPMSKLTKELIDQLGDGVEKADTFPSLVEKAEDAEQAALALDGAARLLAAHKGDLTPEILAEVVKGAGLELPEPEAPAALKAETTAELITALKSAEVDESVITEVEGALEKAAEKASLAKADPETRAAIEKAEKRAEEAERLAKEERDARLSKEFLAKAEAFDSLPTSAEDLGPVLKEASEKLEKASYEALEQLLKAAHEGIKSGELFKTAGADGDTEPGADAYAEIQRKAAELRKSDSDLSEAEAIDKAMAENPELQERYLAEVR